jgi:hypothetical protein
MNLKIKIFGTSGASCTWKGSKTGAPTYEHLIPVLFLLL